MKKLIVLCFCFMSFSAMQAQDFKSDILKYFKLSGGDSGIEIAKSQLLPMIPEQHHAAFTKDFQASLSTFYDKMVEIYMQEYTHTEIKEILVFYDSPVGKKITAKTGELAQKSIQIGQAWGQTLEPIMMKYME